LKRMDTRQIDTVTGETSIYIVPGYTFKVCNALITNFHQPASTLILLVAAFIGKDWKKVYEEALQNGYRFLSYGDSSLLIPEVDSPRSTAHSEDAT
jgi:S-adenosylmethionine:tRNA ribosyltransferase-isomerase